MITDIFARRYEDTTLWTSLQERDERFLVQAWRLMIDRIYPIYTDGKANLTGNRAWHAIHQQLTMELGTKELHPKIEGYFTKWNNNDHWNSITHEWGTVCEKFFFQSIDKSASVDDHMKCRISLLELVFRRRHEELRSAAEAARQQAENYRTNNQPNKLGYSLPEEIVSSMFGHAEQGLSAFGAVVDELNERLRLNRIELRYHNGFVQRSDDLLIETHVASPFWLQVSDAQWKNVDLDMKEAVDRRDNSQRDPAFYAARALESTIKIISDTKGWTHGGEKGAHSFIENLGASKNGQWLLPWEATSLKHFFTEVRNTLGHGPGSASMSQLSPQQTDWAIEFCMSWIKALVRRS